jgi:hypothetical protein
MAVNSCDICGCIPQNIDARFFHQSALNILCDIAANTSGGGVATSVDVTAVVPGTGATNLGKAEDAAHASGDVGVMALAVRNDSAASFGANLDYSPMSVNSVGALQINFDASFQTGSSVIRLEDSSVSEGAALVMAGARRIDTPAANPGSSGDAGFINQNVEGYLYVDTVRRNTMTHTQPSVTDATSFTLVASNTQRKYLLIQNNSAANVMINLNNGTLTGIAPTSTNVGIVLAAGTAYETPANFCPTAAITCYQTSGGTINTISVIEGA